MLLSGQTVKGLPVICGANGKTIGIVSEVQHTPGKKRIDGIIVMPHNRLSGSIYIPLNRITAFGQAAVIVEDDCLDGKEMRNLVSIVGRTVIRDDGQELGTISDIVFDSEDGRIEGYEISKGFIDDLISGRTLLPGNILSSGTNDVFIVPANQSSDLRSNNGGLKNIFFNG